MLPSQSLAAILNSAGTIALCQIRRNLFPILVLAVVLVAVYSGHYEWTALAAFAAMAPPAPKKLAPFRYNTRARFRPAGQTRAWSNNTQLEDVRIPNIGLGARMWIHLHGTMDVDASGAFKDEGPWNILKRIILESNDGGVVNVDLTGYGSYVIGATSIAKGFRPNGLAGETPHVDIYRAGIANDNANAWDLWFPVPINLSQEANRAGGLIAFQSREIQITLKVTTEDVANVVTNVGSGGFTGNLDFYIESYAVPGPGVAKPKFDIIHTFETSKSFTETGYVDFDVPKLGALLSLIHIVKINGARSDVIDRWELTFNDNDTPRKIDRAWLRLLQRIRTGSDLPVGVYSMDFCAGSQNLFDDDMPDVLDTRKIALMQSRIVVSSSASLGSNNNSIRTIRRVIAGARVAN